MVKSLSFFRKVRVFLLTFLVILLFPVLILVTTPILLFRLLGGIFVKYLYWDSKNIVKRVNITSQLLVSDYLKPNPRMNIIYCWIGDGKMNVETFRELFETNIIKRKNTDGKLVYPEIQCYPSNILGYDYWKKIENFDLKDYVKELSWDKPQNSVCTEEDLKNVFSQLAAKKWKRGTSPWECLLINNYFDEVNQTKPKTAILMRFHHFLADGNCIMKMLACLNEGVFEVTAVPDSNLKRNLNGKLTKKSPILGKILSLLLLPYQFAKTFDEILRRDDHEWKVPSKRIHKISQKMHQEWSCRIPLERIKTIKSKFGYSFAAVLNSIVAGAMQNLMRLGKQKVPKTVTTAIQVPLPGHPGGLSNHFGYFLINWPIEEEDPIKRLKLTVEEMHGMEKSAFPLVCYMMYYFAGLLPPILTRGIMSLDSGYSVGFSIFPGQKGNFSWASCKHIEGFHTVGTASGCTGVCFAAYSGMDYIRITILIDDEVSPPKEVLHKLDEIVQKEIAALHSYILE